MREIIKNPSYIVKYETYINLDLYLIIGIFNSNIRRGGILKDIYVIRKRDGSLARFDILKIKNSIIKAANSVDFTNKNIIDKCTFEVERLLFGRFGKKIPNVENIQDIIEEILMKENLGEIVKVYIIYREERHKLRAIKELYNVHDELKLSVNAMHVLQKRYLLRNNKGEVIETPIQMFRRVAKNAAAAEKLYGRKTEFLEEEFFKMLCSLEFLPNSPTLMNAGTKNGQLSACFVLPINDSLDSIFDSLKAMAKIQQSGGGTGFSFSRLRQEGSIVQSTKGIASGPISFMQIYDKTTDIIKQGGKRRGANMAVMNVHHPDILNFINSKLDSGSLKNFNISVGITDEFIRAVLRNKSFPLIDSFSNKIVRKIKAREVFELISSRAWQTGDPGILFLDEINRKHPLHEIIEATNPCGEQPLLAYESCNLGSLNLVKFIANGKINWNKLRDRIRLSVHFLDNVIDVNNYVLPQIKEITLRNRKIGLGIMGFADMLLSLGIPYDSEEALKIAEQIMRFISEEARAKSAELGAERGNFLAFSRSRINSKYKTMRNSTVTTIAPTGTISIIAGVSSGIEPLFAISYARNVLEGTKLFETNAIFENISKERGFYSPELMAKIARTGSAQLENIPKEIKRLFVTSHEISPQWHVKVQAAFQKYTDNAVSKTVNLPENASLKDVQKIYLTAWKLKCKGVTVFRYNSKAGEQVLYLGEDIERRRPVIADAEFSGGCPINHCGN